MKINSSNNISQSFGKICWGTSDRARKTEHALIKLKETNDIDGVKMLKYSDVVEQLQILSDHPDTFEIGCSIIEGHHDASFDINVHNAKTGALISSFSEYFTADYKKGGTKTPIKNDIKSFAKNVLNQHKAVSIKAEVESLMNKLGKVK